MTGQDVSPFQLNRWENEDSRHFYFLETSDYKKIRESRKHCFVVGHRGTGKTSLLKALNWRERLGNATLKGLPGPDPFSDLVVGCYFGLQYLHIDTLDRWLRRAGDVVTHEVMGAYFRGLWIEEAAKAVSAIRRDSGADSVNAEIEAFEVVREDFELWLPDSFERSPNTAATGYVSLRRLRDVAARLTSAIYEDATSFGIDPAQTVAALKLQRLADLTNQIFSVLASLLPPTTGTRPWTFQMCIDEGEYLSESGRRTIRTLVRECRSPLLMTVASLDDLGVDTINPSVRITNHDRLLLDLRKRTLRQFLDLIDGIVNERLKAYPGLESNFSVERVLGAYDLNELLLSARPERPDSRRLIESWQERYKPHENSWSPIRQFLEASSSVSPLADADGDRFDLRVAESSGYRKKFVAGYLKLLITLGIREPIYAGSPIAMRMMENSLRDAFIFLEACFQSSGRSPAPLRSRVGSFVSRERLSISVQNRALKSLAIEKMNGLDERIVTLTTMSRAIVEFLSRLTSRLDMDPNDRAISVPERTHFAFDLPMRGNDTEDAPDRRERSAQTAAIVEAIVGCAREGYLVGGLDPKNPQRLLVRVNRSLAKLHGFSYRSPQYTTRVSWDYLDQISTASSKLDLEEFAARAANSTISATGLGARKVSSADQYIDLPLFDDLES